MISMTVRSYDQYDDKFDCTQRSGIKDIIINFFSNSTQKTSPLAFFYPWQSAKSAPLSVCQSKLKGKGCSTGLYSLFRWWRSPLLGPLTRKCKRGLRASHLVLSLTLPVYNSLLAFKKIQFGFNEPLTFY